MADRARRWLLGLTGPVRADLLRLAVGHLGAWSAGRVEDRYRRRQRGPPGRALVAADLEGQRRTVRVSDIDPQAVLDVDDRHTTVMDIQPIEAAVVDSDPSALVESHDQVCPRDQRVRDADIRAEVTPNDYIGACRERALGSLVPHGQHRWGWRAHEDQLYRQRPRLQDKSSRRFTTSRSTVQ